MGGEVPRLTDRNIIQESRKYLGAAYIFVDRRADAEVQFERIVRVDRDQRMAAATFTQPVVDIFDSVRERVIEEMDAEAAAEAERQRLAREAEIEALRADSERLALLMELAQEAEVREENSRWLAIVPFGVGQFQNHNSGLGIFFAATEGILAAGSLLSFIVYATLDPANYEAPSEAVAQAAFEQDEQTWFIINWVTTGAFLATAIAGVIEAQVNFVPYDTRTEQRDLPEEILPRTPEPEVDVSISPFGASLRVTY